MDCFSSDPRVKEEPPDTWIKEEPSEVREQLTEVSTVAVKSEEPPSSIIASLDLFSPDLRVKEEPQETWIKEEPSEVRDQLAEVSAVATKSEEPRSRITERKTGKKKNFTEKEIETIMNEVGKNKVVLFGSLKSGIKGAQKEKMWRAITASVNSVGRVPRTPREVKKKWSDLKIATKRRLSALKRSAQQTEGRLPDKSLLTATEKRVAVLISGASIEVVSEDEGDTDMIEETLPEESTPGTSGSAAQDGPSQEPEDEPPAPNPRAAASQRRTSPALRRASPLTEEILDRSEEICSQLVKMNKTLLLMRQRLKQINESLKK